MTRPRIVRIPRATRLVGVSVTLSPRSTFRVWMLGFGRRGVMFTTGKRPRRIAT